MNKPPYPDILYTKSLGAVSYTHLDVYKRQVDELHSSIIKHFIPTGIYEEIKRKTVLRAQGHQERLAHYISDIRESSRLLRHL